MFYPLSPAPCLCFLILTGEWAATLHINGSSVQVIDVVAKDRELFLFGRVG